MQKLKSAPNIIDAFHLGLSCPYSYHYISYALCVEVQRVLHIPLAQLAINPFNIATWHAFLLFHSWCLSFLLWGGEKGHQETYNYLHWYMARHLETLEKEHTIKVEALAS